MKSDYVTNTRGRDKKRHQRVDSREKRKKC